MEKFRLFVFLLEISLFIIVYGHKPEDHYKEGEHNLKFDQEAFLGKDQAAEFDSLSTEERKQRLGKLVVSIDKDKDNKITQEELSEHIRMMNRNFVKRDVDSVWEGSYSQKTDKDDKLPWTGYRGVLYGIHEQDGKELDKTMAAMEKRDRGRWKAADKNGDDSLTKEEYACFIHPEAEGCRHMTENVVEEVMGTIDKNGDKHISVEEYLGQWYRPEEHGPNAPEWLEREKTNFKENRDKDKDGKMNLKEMADWMYPDDFQTNKEEARHLIAMADDNKDLVLSKDEILKHYEVFVGSQATDFGQQLRHDPSEL